MKFGEKVVTNKIIVHLSQKVCRLPSPPALLRKFTNMHTEGAIESKSKKSEEYFRDKIEIFIRLLDEHFARHFESH